MELERKVKLFFVAYGRLLFEIIGVMILVIISLQTLNKIVIERQKTESIGSNSSTTYEKNNFTNNEEMEHIKKDKEYISKFIDYCNSGNVEEAYSMLTEKNKQEKYKNLEEFRSEYINKVFDIRVYDYKIRKENDMYTVTLMEDMLITGKKDGSKVSVYKVEGVLERKINICN